ncbi:aminoglycoside phosphotransferase/kinase family protein [Thermocatellispora tengchongensis]|uniref:hypothetical protein n=1 Tax=Thermocatellispora tengchongensis TaxID=1073253 RepID=UPI00362D4DE1
MYLSDPPLPGGLRLPRLYRLDDLGDERLVMWLEDVEVDPAASWDLARYRAAARLLGALAAMRPAPHQDPPDRGLRLFCSGPAAHIMIPALRDPDTWRHPLVAAHADPLLRTDLLALADRIPELLDAVAGLPHTLPHGDASPQNLLVPRDGSAEFVAIDWNWTGSSVIGSDLAQLLAGLPQAGQTEPADLPAVHEAIESAYTEAAGADPAHVSLGYAATLVLRCAWTALPLDRLGEKPTPELEDLFRRRAGLARFIADIGRSLRL